MKKKLLILVTAIMLVLASCGAKPTLAEWVEGDKVTETERQLNELYQGSGIRAEFSIDGDDVLVFSCIYEQQLDFSGVTQETIDTTYATQLDALSPAMVPIFAECKEDTGVDLSCIRIKFVNADGTVIYSRDYTN